MRVAGPLRARSTSLRRRREADFEPSAGAPDYPVRPEVCQIRLVAATIGEMALADQQCVPCRGGVPPLSQDAAEKLLGELDTNWHLNAAGHLERSLAFGNFVMAMEFANRVGEIAEAENHHPDLHVAWGRCTVEIWTHKINGLTESDFVFAAKVDRARVLFEQTLQS